MGVYLSEPNKKKTTEQGFSELLRYSASSMQGFVIFMGYYFNIYFIFSKDGELIWKMLILLTQILILIAQYLEYLMVTGVLFKI